MNLPSSSSMAKKASLPCDWRRPTGRCYTSYYTSYQRTFSPNPRGSGVRRRGGGAEGEVALGPHDKQTKKGEKFWSFFLLSFLKNSVTKFGHRGLSPRSISL